MRVMVLAGGPDREREVSLMSGAEVAAALTVAGHEVRVMDAGPDDLSALSAFEQWNGDVIFPAMHGPWGEGGPLQNEMEQRGVAYVGCGPDAASLCMDKVATKQVLRAAGVPTPDWEVVEQGKALGLDAPAVVKPTNDGSSVDTWLCHDEDAFGEAVAQAHSKEARFMAERMIVGKELTVGVLDGGVMAANQDDAQRVGEPIALQPIWIMPAGGTYDYQAKYFRDDTQYEFDIDVPGELLERIKAKAIRAYRLLGCRHLCRVDFLVDDQGCAWVLEVNTMPGFTTHSLLPMAAAEAGLAMPQLTDRLVRAACRPR